MRLLSALAVATAVLSGVRASIASIVPTALSTSNAELDFLQRFITWDGHSFFIRGERMVLFSGEIHPFRLPVPDLWLDVFQKVKALGFNTVSFSVDWALLEGRRGQVVTEGIWNLDPFFKAASEAGIYLIARPGPYINADVAAGGIPGWLLRSKAVLRSNDTEWLDAINDYIAIIGRIIANNQITNGGPVILVQSENEYSSWQGVSPQGFPAPFNKAYFAALLQKFREAGIIVPLINNDDRVLGSFAPGTGQGEVDVYGISAYPLNHDCTNPRKWPSDRALKNLYQTHLQQSPSTPFSISDFQGGSVTSWGSVRQELCAALVNHEAERVLHKQLLGSGVKLLNIDMLFGGTNWGNLGSMEVDSSYDYGAAISENRFVNREKYSELKLQANFLKVSPAYLTSIPGETVIATYTNNTALATTPLADTRSDTRFYVVRHADFTSNATVNYRLNVFCSLGNVSIPQMAGVLTLTGRDSKIHVTDYDIGGFTLRYNTAEVFTWTKEASGKVVLILYGGEGEWHEFAVSQSLGRPITGNDTTVIVGNIPPVWAIKWQVTKSRKIVRFDRGGLEVHLLWRNDAYRHWVLELPAPSPISNYSSPSKQNVIVRGGYLIRTAGITGSTLSLRGDINATADIEIISEPTGQVNQLVFNDIPRNTSRNADGYLRTRIEWNRPPFFIEGVWDSEWKYIDSLPELRPTYDDSNWTACDRTSTNNTVKPDTPTVLYAGDYGFHTGSLLYRGHFTATGNETTFYLKTSGGWGYGHSVWINSTFIGSWVGSAYKKYHEEELGIPPFLQPNGRYVITVLIDYMGQGKDVPGSNIVKEPFGLLNYSLSGHTKDSVTWKLTGNLGGESYKDLQRGPRNEGALYAERQGYHLPGRPADNWQIRNPRSDGIPSARVGFFTTTFDLNLPQGWDIPVSIIISNNTIREDNKQTRHYRVQLFVNGFQFGKFVSHLGPQNRFLVPKGILNHNGSNQLALTVWAQDPQGVRVGGIIIDYDFPILSGYRKPKTLDSSRWQQRIDAY